MKIYTSLLNLIFPKHCLSCRRKNSNLCSYCASLIISNKTQHCYRCAKTSLHGKTCDLHFEKESHSTLDGLLIAAHYNGNQILKKAIKIMKYKSIHEDIDEHLGILLAKTLTPFLNSRASKFILIPVPLHEERFKERGFNQSELLIKKCIQKIKQEHYPLLTSNYELLKRTKNTLQQASTKSRQERFKNLKNAFHISDIIDPSATYILIDDVLSTGTTLEKCCKTLKKARAKTVWGLVLGSNK